MPARHPLLGWIGLGAIVLIWQLASANSADFTLLPTPADVWAAGTAMWQTGELARHIGASLVRLTAGWGLGAGLGVLTGFAMAILPPVRALLSPPVHALFAIPKIALLPLFIVWLGIGEMSKVVTIAVGVFSPMAVIACAAVDGVDRGLIRMAQSFDLPPRHIIAKILLPAALPGLLTGVRVSASVAIVLLVGAEMIGAQHGIGALALQSGGLMRTDRLFVALGVLGFAGLALSLAVAGVERAVLRGR